LQHSRPALARAHTLLPWLLLAALGARPAGALDLGSGFALGGDAVLTSDYVYRGVSSSNNEAALQGDLHVMNAGSFLGVWGSTRDNQLEPYANFDLEVYLGHRFDLSNAWSATVSARAHYLLGGPQETSDDYQELGASVSYLDLWTLSVTAIPSAVRYWETYYGYERLSRAPAFVAETSFQWLLHAGFYLTGGAGYYHVTGTGPGIEAANGYPYGNVGIAYDHHPWRVDVGYYRTGDKAQRLFPYPSADHQVAASVAWRF
jgi:uncharacterized protein (TIGR02001 family)